jgi:glucan 1,3-beta-glucosidase
MHSDTGKNSLHPSGSLSYLKGGAGYLQGDEEDQSSSKKSVERSRARLAFFCLVIIGVGVICGAYFGGGRNDIFPAADASSSPSASATPSNPAGAIITYGGSGAVVTTEQGSTFTYNNSFGGYFVVEKGNPFNNNARAQSWSPPLNQSWQFGKDQILGYVNSSQTSLCC